MSPPDLELSDLKLVKIGKAAIRVVEAWRRYMDSSKDDIHRERAYDAYNDAAEEMDNLIDDYKEGE